MNIRDRLIEICKENRSDYWGDIEPSSWSGSADQILEEFWPIPKEYFDCKTLTDGTVVFEPKPEDDDYYCCCGDCG